MTKEKHEDAKKNVVDAAATSVSVTLVKGAGTSKSSSIDLLQGGARVYAKHTGTTGTLRVLLKETIFWDDTVREWTLSPGESINYFNLSLPKKDTYYMQLVSSDRTASGTGTLGQPYYV